MADYPSIPSISSKLPRELTSLLSPMREILRMFTSTENPVARAAQLVEAGLIVGIERDGALVPSPSYDATPPPAPTNLTAGGALATVILTWDASSAKNIAYTEVWRAQTNDFSLAQLIGRADGRLYTDSIGGGASRFYWIRYVSEANIPGPFNAQAGVAGATGNDATYLIEVLSANPPEGATFNPLLYVQQTPTTINGVAVPAGTYMSSAYMANGSIGNAQMGNAAIDDAKIASLSAVKITSGDVAAARIQANIVSALVGKYNTLSALTASIGQLQIDAGGYLRTEGVTSYTNGTGIWMGQVGGAYKMRIGNPSGNYMQWDGTNLIVVGSGIFSGSLNAATGSFAGTLSAATGTFAGILSAATGSFAGSLNAATGSFAGSLSAATGTFSGALTADAINAVNTINLAGQAVTIPLGVGYSNMVSTSSSLVIAQVGPYTSIGAPVCVVGNASVVGSWVEDPGGLTSSIQLCRNGVALVTKTFSITQEDISLITVDTPPAGAVTYTLVLNNGGLPGATAYTRSLFSLECKR